MDLDYLFQRRQTSLFMAEHAASCETRRIHEEFAELCRPNGRGAACPHIFASGLMQQPKLSEPADPADPFLWKGYSASSAREVLLIASRGAR